MARKDRQEEIEEEKPNVMRELLGMLVYVGIVLAITFLIITFVGQRTHVSGESMENTLDDGDQLIVDKLTYRFHDPERFDIIVFPFRYKDNTYYIKRIIGLPGETVQIVDGEIYINGELLEESYGREVMQDAGLAAEPITLGDDEYFVLGDNRNYSSDSRDPSVALIHRKEIIGRAWLRIWPLNSFGILKHQ
ncbi:signal peptidase I [Laedolimicola ammoniilytica]|uniref:Signal peptidase I n=1 Tax=Laedolimicola ammoniilytica TaxID=2981771 RepID=A0ABT2RUX1_9FIRM|nr:signal peptidase I [Laedolimicola ammoniilytica]MCU6696110.1 signal peptidase I [Laedolimicola ammoniilytica]SCH45277.1 Signal peptidase IB [uncultured Clostridium sp.]SCH86353.1 Signal peptidase IB [uncultured Clostridium sp.]